MENFDNFYKIENFYSSSTTSSGTSTTSGGSATSSSGSATSSSGSATSSGNPMNSNPLNGLDNKAKILKTILISILYDIINKEKKRLETIKQSQNKQIDNNSVNNDGLNDLNNKNKRLIEINTNISRKKEYVLYILKIILIIVGVLVIIPILKKLGILSKKLALMLMGVIVLIILIVSYYLLYIRIETRDNNKFDNYLFANPNSEEILKSKLNVELSEVDQARCSAFDELESNKTDIDGDKVSQFIDDNMPDDSKQKCVDEYHTTPSSL